MCRAGSNETFLLPSFYSKFRGISSHSSCPICLASSFIISCYYLCKALSYFRVGLQLQSRYSETYIMLRSAERENKRLKEWHTVLRVTTVGNALQIDEDDALPTGVLHHDLWGLRDDWSLFFWRMIEAVLFFTIAEKTLRATAAAGKPRLSQSCCQPFLNCEL